MSDKKYPLEQNESGDFLPVGHKNEDIDEAGQMAQMAKAFPDVCAHPECEKTPIVGVNRRFVCEDHLDWVMTPVKDLLQLVRENFGD